MARQDLDGPLRLVSRRLGPLPIINHFLNRLGVGDLLERFVPATDPRCRLAPAKALGVLLRSILVEREPIYRHQEVVSGFATEAFGLGQNHVRLLADDQLGRALDRLFDADRANLLTEVAVATHRRFAVDFAEFHNDSTSIRFSGQYPLARGRPIRGRRGRWITYGFSKDHRPDLKQLLWIMSSTRDGAIPMQFRCADGNTNDADTHIQTWEALKRIAGRSDFLYVADSKLCAFDPMDHLHRNGGRFVTVMPRSRQEDTEFREWVQSHEPTWELVIDRCNPRAKYGPRDRWWVYRASLPSREGWPVIWVRSSLLALKQQRSRRERLAKAVEQLEDLERGLASGRCRTRTEAEVYHRVQSILRPLHIDRYLDVQVQVEMEHHYRQLNRGRPGPNTRYRRASRQRLHLNWVVDEAKIVYDQHSDGMYPLLTNDPSLRPGQVLEAHKSQPALEKRFEQLKSVHELAPVLLKNEGRIEAFFVIYFLALLVQSLIERDMRRAMERENIKEMPLYPEDRLCRHPTTQQLFRIFAPAERHLLYSDGELVQVFHPELSPLQRQILRLLGVPRAAYRASS